MNNKMQNDRPLSIGALRRRKGLCRFLASVSAAMFLLLSAAPAFAFSGTYFDGAAKLVETYRVSKVDVNAEGNVTFSSSAASAVLDWSKFNIPVGKSMDFNGTDALSKTTFFNLVDGAAGKSQIDGMINGSGNVWVINPAGIAFGAGATVNVGGLFAAAAGTVKNAAELRSGTVAMPEFSSFAGTVDVPGGTFTADRVALLGKTVKVDGAVMKNIGQLAIGAGDGMAVVDYVGDGEVKGKVTVNITDFAADSDATSVILGDIELGGGTDIGGGIVLADEGRGLDVRAGNGIAVTGQVNTDGDAKLFTKNGDINVGENGGVNANGAFSKVELGAGEDTGSRGNITIDGQVTADLDYGYGSINAFAGYGDDTTASRGDLSVNGAIMSGGAVEIGTYHGKAEIGENGVVASLGSKTRVEATDSVKVDGVLSSSSKTMVYGDLGEVTIGENGVVQTTGMSGEIQIISAMADNANAQGDVDVQGTVEAKNAGNVWIAAGFGEGAFGDANVSGTVKAGYQAEIDASDHVVIEQSGFVLAKAGGEVTLNGGLGVESRGSVAAIKGSVTAYALDGDVDLGEGKSGIVVADTVTAMAKGDINVNGERNIIADPVGSFFFSLGGGNVTVDNDENGLALDMSEFVARYNPDDYVKGVVAAGNIVVCDDIALPEQFDANVYSINGDVSVLGGASLSAGNVALVAMSGDLGVNGSLAAKSVDLEAAGDIQIGRQASIEAMGNGAVVVAHAGANLTSAGTVAADNGVVMLVAEKDVEVGNVSAGSFVVVPGENPGEDQNLSVQLLSHGGKVTVRDGGVVEATHADGSVFIQSQAESDGGVEISGMVRAAQADGSGNGQVFVLDDSGAVDVKGLVSADGEVYVNVRTGAISVDGSVSGGNQVLLNAQKIDVGGSVSGGDTTMLYADSDVEIAGRVSGEKTVLVDSKGGHVSVGGRVSSAETAMVSAQRGVNVKGEVSGAQSALVLAEGGDITIGGKVSAPGADGLAMLWARDGGVRFANGGTMSGTQAASVTAKGSVTQDGVSLPYRQGRMDAVSLSPAMSGKEVVLQVGGSIGNGASSPLVVDGKAYAVAFGDMSIAGAYGKSLAGGDASSVASANDTAAYTIDSARKMIDGTLTIEEAMARMSNPSDFDDNRLVYAAGDMYVYTAGRMEANGLFKSGGDMTVSAAKFGDMSYLQAGGLLTINNVGSDRTPQIAYFESVDGREPKINNQPNDMVIFIDGRLAGGNLQVINKFGATEAFPVSTPELKSEQGIFGNPVFMHGDLDVANPMAVGNVDYMLQEIPRLTLASDFPLEIDKSVNTAGLNPKDVYRFGQHPQVAEEKPQAEQEEKKDDKASAEKSAEPKVAMR